MKRGFTLIEVLLAMAIFVAGVTAILGMFQFGGGLERTSRSYSELAPAIRPLVERLKYEAWQTDPTGSFAGLREYIAEPVPGAKGYKFDLMLYPEGAFPATRLAEIHIWRGKPERVVARVPFMLPRRVPVARRLQDSSQNASSRSALPSGPMALPSSCSINTSSRSQP